MKILTVRDVRHRWPEAEALLQEEGEILITRDSKPVARLVRVAPAVQPRRRFDPVAHGRWQRRISGGRVSRWVDGVVAEARADRRAGRTGP